MNHMSNSIFNELFVLELANNHLGNVERGLQIIEQHAKIVRFNNVHATIKLQLRDLDTFIHKDFVDRKDIRYIKKTLETRLPREHIVTLVHAVKASGCLTSATPFDEASVDFCQELNVDLLKIASSDLNDWVLIEKIARARKPVIASTGGSSLKDIEDLVTFFHNRSLPLALNHCVSIYPSENGELELNQIDFLRDRFPNVTIGFSTHEYGDWNSSIMMAYAKGARTFERHIDIETPGASLSPYCSLPHQIDTWFRSMKKAADMCGSPGTVRRQIPAKEIKYLDALVRGVYARRDLAVGHRLTSDDIYLAIPLMKGQISCRELMLGDYGHLISKPCSSHQPIFIDAIESPYSSNASLRDIIYQRGV